MRTNRRRRLNRQRRHRVLLAKTWQRFDAGMLVPGDIVRLPHTGGPFIGKLGPIVSFYRNT